jgi:hypothetical protein
MRAGEHSEEDTHRQPATLFQEWHERYDVNSEVNVSL